MRKNTKARPKINGTFIIIHAKYAHIHEKHVSIHIHECMYSYTPCSIHVV